MAQKAPKQKMEKAELPHLVTVTWPLENGANVAEVIRGVFLLLCKQYSDKYLLISQIYSSNEEIIGLRHQVRTKEQVEILRASVVDKNRLHFVFFVYPAPPTE
ncbi:hypothetical protein A2572_02795 [Candidatus Collierbacteria bacterium RIFOXYD1_FULL_40_9]|uniref:Uncharacterized protein n=1 Tax=Candidatus Collierbacteria bacterium RIFOXYD1_FULL_40_9 TaxID=1817731 RepID=A0A1F5FU85_9BACT|nr:MAG: hypothetical protein A2572_02795 [Candidatus Collierbacteria bacterium RIFOXYD1_FULL_40_9]